MAKSGPSGIGSEATIHLVLHLNPNVQNVLGQLPSLPSTTEPTSTTSLHEGKRNPPQKLIDAVHAQLQPRLPENKDDPPAQRPNTPETEPTTTMTTTTEPPARQVPDYARGLYSLAEAMVGALGQGEVSAIWRWPDTDERTWEQFIDPKFQSCIAEALLDLSRVSTATIWQVVRRPMARTHFLQFIKYEYSVTKLAMKGTYRQLDAKSDLTDAFKNACEFFRVWRP